MPDNFSFNARYGLFTYAQCGDLDPHDVCCHFTSLQAECIIGREHHSDGGTHLHVFADFGRKRRFRRATTFDVSGRHPNIVPSRGTPRGGYDYATKDGDIVGGGLERPSGRDGTESTNKDSAMAELVSIEDSEEFWDAVRRLAPGLLLRNFPSLNAYACWRFRPAVKTYETPGSIRFETDSVPELGEWRQNNLGVDSGVR